MADRVQEMTHEPGKTPDTARTPDMQERAREMGSQARDWAEEKGNQLKEAGTQARDWAEEKGHQLKQGAQEATRRVGATASQLSDMGSEAVDQLTKSLEDRIRYKPLQSVLIAAGAGMLLGLLWRK